MLGVDDTAFNNRQQITLNTFSRRIGALSHVARVCNLIDFIQKHNTIFFDLERQTK
jgi:hypothetical protein